MGDINLIPGQQARGEARLGKRQGGSTEYTHPASGQPSPLPIPSRPTRQGWWAQRKRLRAARAQARAVERHAQQAARAQTPVAQPLPSPMKRPAVELNLLKDKTLSLPATPPPPRRVVPPPAAPTTPPDFVSDSGFRDSKTLPASEAYSIRRPPTHPKPVVKLKKKEHTPHTPAPEHAAEEGLGPLVDVNLIPHDMGGKQKPLHPWTEIVWYALAAVVLVGAGYGGLRWYEYTLTQDSAELQAQIQELEQDVHTYSAQREEANVIQTQLLGLQSILDQHVQYSDFFQFLQDNTLPSVYYKSLNVNARTGAVSASAVTSDFDQLRAQVAVLESHSAVSNVSVTSATRTVPTAVTDGEFTESAPTTSVTILFSISWSVDQQLFLD